MSITKESLAKHIWLVFARNKVIYCFAKKVKVFLVSEMSSSKIDSSNNFLDFFKLQKCLSNLVVFLSTFHIFLDGNDTRKGNETGGGSRPEKLGKTPEILMGCKKPSNKPRAAFVQRRSTSSRRKCIEHFFSTSQQIEC